MNKKEFQHKRTAVMALLVWFALMWSWTFSTDSLELSGSHTQGVVVAAIVSFVNVGISTWVIWTAFSAVKRLFRRHELPLALLASLGVFSLADFMVAWLSAVIWLGPQGSIDNVLPLGSPTLLLINTPLGFASRLTGFYGLAAFAWLVIFLLTHRRYRNLMIYPVSALCLLSFAGWSLYRSPNGTTIKAEVVNESLDTRISPVRTENTAFVLFPENSFNGLDDTKISSRVTSHQDQATRFIGSRLATRDNGERINTLVYGDTSSGIVNRQDKHRLIPGGEDLSYVGYAILPLIGQRSTVDYFTMVKKIYKGREPLQPIDVDKNTIVGAAVCSSIISPEDYRKLTRSGATILTNSASLGIFNGSPLFSWQQKSLAKFMSLSNARYFLQSANDATTFVLDTNGRTIASTQRIEALSVSAQNNTRKTFYTQFGEWIAMGGVISVFIMLIWSIRSKKSLHESKEKKSTR